MPSCFRVQPRRWLGHTGLQQVSCYPEHASDQPDLWAWQRHQGQGQSRRYRQGKGIRLLRRGKPDHPGWLDSGRRQDVVRGYHRPTGHGQGAEALRLDGLVSECQGKSCLSMLWVKEAILFDAYSSILGTKRHEWIGSVVQSRRLEQQCPAGIVWEHMECPRTFVQRVCQSKSTVPALTT